MAQSFRNVTAALLAAVILFCTSEVLANYLGRSLFEPCRSCHALDPAAKALPGPRLAGLIGRKIGADPAFDYSPVLRTAAAQGQNWTRERLDRFLADPEAMFPGMWMTARPMPDAAQRKALGDFLADPNSR